jgi:hypothetical protein
MATLIDEEQVVEMELQEGEEVTSINEDNPQEAFQSVEEPQAEEPEPVEENPDRFSGKSHDELLQMVREQDRTIGQQGNELGNLRQTFEAMTKAQSVPAQPEPEPVEEADFFVDPQKAVDQRINSHPALREAQEMAQKLAYAQGLMTLQQRHPDIKEVIGNAEFKQWVESNPARAKRYQYADQTGDVEEADDLISTWKQLNKTVATAKQAEKTAQKKAVRAAATAGPRGNADAATSKRVYRRADIRQLMKTDEDRYQALMPEIMQAYAEGRVRD